jgi:fumarate reductase flavoprotein subunit
MKQLDTDVSIVGGGTAGLAAAVAAAQGGAQVIVFEKAATSGGAGNMAMGPFAVESRLQRQKKYSLTKEEAFKIQMDFTHMHVDARLVKYFIDKSASTIDWLEKMGVEFTDVHSHNQGFHYTWHTVKLSTGDTGPGAAATMMKILTDRAKELGVKILLKTAVKKVLKEGARIAGVIAEEESGEEIKTNTKSVVIATGGFGDNPGMLKKYTGYEWGKDLFSTRIPGVVGDGLRMAWEIGAAPTATTIHLTCGLSEMTSYFTVAFAFNQPNLMVNIQGERVINEEFMQTTPFFGNIVARQKNRCAFMIFDEDTKKYYQETGLDFLAGVMLPFNLTTIDNFDNELKQAVDKGSKEIFPTNTLEELAAKTGINPEELKKTIAEYNQACETGRDMTFYKNPKYLRPVKRPPFYVAKLVLGGFGTLGGIKINYRTEVLNKDFEVIPGLYAAGVDANSINGDTYIFILPGSTFGFAVNSGRIAGEEAARYIKSS